MVAVAKPRAVLKGSHHTRFICKHKAKYMRLLATPESGGLRYVPMEKQLLDSVYKLMGKMSLEIFMQEIRYIFMSFG